MLLAIRERIMGFLGWVILGILFVAFAFFGLNSYLQDDVSSFAAVVNGEEISQAQYQQAYDQLRRKMEQQLGESFDPALLDENMLRAGSLQQLINQTLLIQAADSEGFAASNEQIALSINAVDAFKEDGVFSKDKYEQVLGYQGIRPAGFEHSLKQDIMANQFTVGVSATAAAPADNLVQAYVLEGQQRRFKYLLLPLSGFTEHVPVSDEDIQTYYETHADAFMTPERVRAQYLELDAATLDTGVEISEEALQVLYEEQAEKYIKSHKDKPFFLYFSSQDIHVPRTPHPRFHGKSQLGYRGDAMVQFDWSTGEIMRILEENGLAENTIVIFSSDNGPVYDDGYDDGTTVKTSTADNDRGHYAAGLYRGGKYQIYEGGTRVPFLIRWPAKIKPGKSDALVSQVDLLASFADLLDIELTKDQAPDSQNILKAFLGQDKVGLTEMIEEIRGTIALRNGHWKFVMNRSGLKAKNNKQSTNVKDELYNLKEDIAEKNNIIEKYPEKAAMMQKRLKEIIRN